MPSDRSTATHPTDARAAGSSGLHQELDLTPGDHLYIPETPLRPGWSRPRPAHLPRPTYWPAVLGLGVMFIGWGLTTSAIVSVVGLVLFAIGLAGWIGDMRNAHD